jgi:hypothetical protein
VVICSRALTEQRFTLFQALPKIRKTEHAESSLQRYRRIGERAIEIA